MVSNVSQNELDPKYIEVYFVFISNSHCWQGSAIPRADNNFGLGVLPYRSLYIQFLQQFWSMLSPYIIEEDGKTICCNLWFKNNFTPYWCRFGCEYAPFYEFICAQSPFLRFLTKNIVKHSTNVINHHWSDWVHFCY